MVRYLSREPGLAFATSGEVEARPLLFINGMGGAMPAWYHQARRFEGSRRVITYDHRGNGRSPEVDAPGEMATFAGDLLALMDELSVATADLVGVSFGGRLAQFMALNHPERVSSITLVATQAGPAGGIRGHGTLEEMGEMSAERFVEEVLPLLFGERYRESHRHHLEVFARARARNPQSPSALRRQMSAARGFDPRERLHTITHPTLVIHGEEDALCPISEAETLFERIPDSRLVRLEGIGHSPNIEDHGAFNDHLAAFLGELAARG